MKQIHAQIPNLMEPPKFWSYKSYPQEVISAVKAYLIRYKNQLSSVIDSQKSLEQNYETLCEVIGVAVHPCLQNLQKQESDYPKLRNSQYGVRLLQISNYRIDGFSLCIIGFLLTFYRVDTLKLSRNELDGEASSLKWLLDLDFEFGSLFLEWNPLIGKMKKDVYLSAVKPCLKHLFLRQNNLENLTCIEIMRKIRETNNMALKSLDLSGNQLTMEIGGALCKFIQEQQNLQFLGLAKNKLSGVEFLKKLFSSMGQIQLNETQFLKHEELLKLRNETIARNQNKKKGSADEPLPSNSKLKINDKGKFMIKNTSIQNLSLAKNGIGDTCIAVIRQFAEKQGKGIQLFLEGNKFSARSKHILHLHPSLLM